MFRARPFLSQGLSFLLAPTGIRSAGLAMSLLYSEDPAATNCSSPAPKEEIDHLSQYKLEGLLKMLEAAPFTVHI